MYLINFNSENRVLYVSYKDRAGGTIWSVEGATPNQLTTTGNPHNPKLLFLAGYCACSFLETKAGETTLKLDEGDWAEAILAANEKLNTGPDNTETPLEHYNWY